MESSIRFPEPPAGPYPELDCFQLLADITDYAVFLLNLRGEIIQANAGAKGFEPLSIDPSWIEAARRAGKISRDTALRRTNGTIAEVHVSLYAVAPGLLVIVRDVASERKLERELRLNNAKLIAETQRAEHASLAKSRFIATVSHEIRTPLNAILGMADMLWDSSLDTNQRHYVSVFQRAGHRLLNLINNLLDLSKIESGRFDLEQIEFHLDEVVQRSVELMSPRAHAKGLALNVHLDPSLPLARTGDPNRLQQIFINLLSNSIKFTETGSVSLSIAAGAAADGLVEITVADTGIGIPQEKVATIFRDFSQAEASTARRYGGTGLGLGIVRRLVELMGGRVDVESELGKGTKFHVSLVLPAGKGQSARPPALPPLPPPNGKSEAKRLLIAEDSSDNQILLKAYFENTGYSVTFVEDGHRAVQQFEAGRYDLILMDVLMPGMDGWTAARAIRSLERERGLSPTPIIALSASAMAADIENSRRAGCQDHLIKPISRKDLLAAITRCSQPPSSPSAVSALVPAYLEKRRHELPMMLELLAHSDYTRIATLAHNLKGTGSAYGFPQITNIGADLERAAKNSDSPSVEQQLQQLKDFLSTTSRG